MESHKIWFKTMFNPILRKINLEICSIERDNKIIGFGIRKYK